MGRVLGRSMSAPPGIARNPEALIPAGNPVSESPHSHIPRRWVKDAIRVLTDMGYAVSGAQAWHLIKEYRDWQAGDARRFVADEFGVYVQRRGDLMRVRGKVQHAWRVSS